MADSLVLIVEDNVLNRKLVRDLLQHAGYRTLETDSAVDALALARVHCPDLILLDIQLPDVDGLTLFGQLRAEPELTRIPVVALTAFAMHADRERFLAAGFDGYLPKPIDVRRFVDQVRGFCK